MPASDAVAIAEGGAPISLPSGRSRVARMHAEEAKIPRRAKSARSPTTTRKRTREA
jgi:hypothetical protein